MIIRNFLNFVKNNRLLFVLLAITQVIAVVIILFSFGIYRNNRYKLAEGESRDKSLIFSPKENVDIEISRVRDKIVEVSKKYSSLIDSTYIPTKVNLTEYSPEDFENMSLVYSGTNIALARSEFKVVNGEILFRDVYTDNILLTIDEDGRGFTEDELTNGARVCLVPYEAYEMQKDKFEINGISYEIIGHEKKPLGLYATSSREFNIPLMSLPDDAKLSVLCFNLKRPLLRSEYEAIRAEFIPMILSENEVDISGFYSIEIDEKATIKTMMVAAVFMSLISAFSVCIIYRYMLAKRVKTTAIYRICGCTRLKSSLIYIGEMVMVLAGSCAAGSLLFELIVEPRLEKSYTWFSVIYKNGSSYLLVLLYFVIVSGIASVMIAASNRRTPKELLSGKMK